MQPFAVLQLLQSLFPPSQPQSGKSAPPFASEPSAEQTAAAPPSADGTNGAVNAEQTPPTDEHAAVLHFLERHERRAGRLKK